MKSVSIIVASIVTVAGCAREEAAATRHGVLDISHRELSARVRPGMSRADVLKVVGLPERRFSFGEIVEATTNASGESITKPIEAWFYDFDGVVETGNTAIIFTETGTVRQVGPPPGNTNLPKAYPL
jgi:hypothetical protein